VILYAWAPFAAWSVFANLATPLGAGAMFVAEYLVRYRLHPEFERVDFATAWRTYQGHRDHGGHGDRSGDGDPRRHRGPPPR